jgi:hypothetical protein
MSSRRPQKPDENKRSKRRPRTSKRRPKAPRAPEVRRSIIDPELPADQPLSPEEVVDMKRHLRFVDRYKAVLRPRLNAKEARMVDGSLEPEHRGTCLHLLSKIDRGTILAALEREPVKSDAQARARFLATAAGISGDVGILLHFLEALCAAGQSDHATRAFTRAIERIDFEAISAARMGRLLDVMQQAFGERELVGALFGLLRNPGFVAAFDGHAAELEPGIAARFLPLRAVHQAIFGRGRPGPGPLRELAQGLPLVLAVPPGMLTAYPVPVRERLLAAALDIDDDAVLGHPGIEVLLASLPADGEASARHGLALARSRLSRGELEPARKLLEGLRKGPAGSEASALLTRLGGTIVGPLALERDASEPADGLQPAFHLQRLEPVWLRFAPAGGGGRFDAEADLQAAACLPGVAGVRERGRARGRGAFVVVAAEGRRLDEALADREVQLSAAQARELALAGVRVLRALALAGLALSDAAPHRFLLPWPGAWQHLVLADLGGVVEIGVPQASLHARDQAARWTHGALCFPPFRGERLRREVPRRLVPQLDKLREEGADPVLIEGLLGG